MEFKPEKRELSLDVVPSASYTALIYGSTRSGKSTVIDYLLKNWFGGRVNVLFTESPNAVAYKEDGFKKSSIICPSWEPAIINTMAKINKHTENHYLFNAILDDCSPRECKTFKKLMTYMRNQGISTIIGIQSLSQIGPIARSSVHFVALGKMNNSAEIEKCIKSYLQGFFPSTMKMVDKIQMYEKLTANHHWIMVNNLTDEAYIFKIKI